MHLPLLFLTVFCLLNYALAGEKLLHSCLNQDVMSNCVPVCPKICSDFLYKRKCKPRKCQKGCACPHKWLRHRNDQGLCIPRNECRRYIIE
ncbi:venom serine protease inhibitor [Drosophila ficusphila]|uniref:venom serine protease inhibitor n=1 Tax=Drosophila ficusphila TaxID=30025 RepID=UPI0007E6F7E3|nr:venom serine protease inhibitor [Drosophila ficusphila]